PRIEILFLRQMMLRESDLGRRARGRERALLLRHHRRGAAEHHAGLRVGDGSGLEHARGLWGARGGGSCSSGGGGGGRGGGGDARLTWVRIVERMHRLGDER